MTGLTAVVAVSRRLDPGLRWLRRARTGGATTANSPLPRGTLLLITRDSLLGRALESAFAPAGYQVTHAGTPIEAVEVAGREPPDAVVLHADLLQADPSAAFSWLRQSPEIGRRTPLVVVATSRLTAGERRDAIRAGAWYLAEMPFSPADLANQLDVFVAAKREAERYRNVALLDPATGLYTPAGIRHRALELASLVARAHQPLACVVFSPATSATVRDMVLQAIVQSLRDLGRRSDAVGELGDGKYIVVAPATPAQGATQLAERFARSMHRDLRQHLRAGYDVADPVDQPALVAPRLIDHARQAAEACVAGNGDQWLRGFRETSGP